ncbi:MAG TPA: hypothetical protein VGE07_18555 [Herpetosiphonaceae bacterium]
MSASDGKSEATIDIYLEIGEKKVIAGALEWPGWCRAGRDEAGALQALLDAGPRYAKIIGRTAGGVRPPDSPDAFKIAERLEGTATTDFGAPDIAPKRDSQPFDDDERKRSLALLEKIWRAFDQAVEGAEGKTLALGPRGGGRPLEKIARHVLESEQSYLRRLARSVKIAADEKLPAAFELLRDGVKEALAAAARGELPEHGPRGGALWLPRYYVRRSAWHLVDHIWEIEDRSAAAEN